MVDTKRYRSILMFGGPGPAAASVALIASSFFARGFQLASWSGSSRLDDASSLRADLIEQCWGRNLLLITVPARGRWMHAGLGFDWTRYPTSRAPTPRLSG